MCKMNADNFIICGGMIEKLKKINPQNLQLDFGKLSVCSNVHHFVYFYMIKLCHMILNIFQKTILLTLCTLSWQLLDYKVN